MSAGRGSPGASGLSGRPMEGRQGRSGAALLDPLRMLCPGGAGRVVSSGSTEEQDPLQGRHCSRDWCTASEFWAFTFHIQGLRLRRPLGPGWGLETFSFCIPTVSDVKRDLMGGLKGSGAPHSQGVPPGCTSSKGDGEA
jgi:hypothetical protein